MQSLEYFKDAFEIDICKTDAIIGNRDFAREIAFRGTTLPDGFSIDNEKLASLGRLAAQGVSGNAAIYR
jgi:hypothetical protein